MLAQRKKPGRPEKCEKLGLKPLKWVENQYRCGNLDFMKVGFLQKQESLYPCCKEKYPMENIND